MEQITVKVTVQLKSIDRWIYIEINYKKTLAWNKQPSFSLRKWQKTTNILRQIFVKIGIDNIANILSKKHQQCTDKVKKNETSLETKVPVQLTFRTVRHHTPTSPLTCYMADIRQSEKKSYTNDIF